MSRASEIDKIAHILYTISHLDNYDLELRGEIAEGLVDHNIRSKDGFIIDNNGFPTEGHIKARDYLENYEEDNGKES